MKTFNNISKNLFGGLFAALLSLFSISAVHAQIFVTNFYGGTVGEYDSATGAAINASLISGLSYPVGVAVSGSNLFVANSGNNEIGEYTTSGATTNASLLLGVNAGVLAVSGPNLFISNGEGTGNGTIGAYTTSGATVNRSLISELPGYTAALNFALSGSDIFVGNTDPTFGFNTIGEYTTSGVSVNPSLLVGVGSGAQGDFGGIAVFGSDLFIANFNAGTIGEYTTSGATINASLITGLTQPTSIAISGNNLYVVNYGSSTIGEYNATTGAIINASLVSGLNGPVEIAVEAEAVPEPSTWALLLGGLGLLAFWRTRIRRSLAWLGVRVTPVGPPGAVVTTALHGTLTNERA